MRPVENQNFESWPGFRAGYNFEIIGYQVADNNDCFEAVTQWKSYQCVRAPNGGELACLAHGLQCLRDGRACCPPRALQLVICRT